MAAYIQKTGLIPIGPGSGVLFATQYPDMMARAPETAIISPSLKRNVYWDLSLKKATGIMSILNFIQKVSFVPYAITVITAMLVEIKSTFTEWKNSIYAEKGIQCQDCHMNTVGFLLQGKPVYDSGCAVNPSNIVRAPDRPKLYTHSFPGAHSRTQIFGAGVITLNMETEKTIASPGDEMTIYVFIDNSRTGHKMPSGSADLRQLWLKVEVYNGDKIMPVPALMEGPDTYDVAGKGPFDQEILGEDIPKGARIYRAIFIDKKGMQTLSSYDAVNIAFDNRLNASELRRETYHFTVPKDVKGKLTVKASLNYLPYPSSFSQRFGLPGPEAFEISSTRKEIHIKQEQ